MMKKFLGIVVLYLIFCNMAYANCMNDLEVKTNATLLSNRAYAFEFLNNNNKSITITEIKLLTSDDQIIKSKMQNLVIKSFGRIVRYIDTDDINLKVWKKTSLSCRYN